MKSVHQQEAKYHWFYSVSHWVSVVGTALAATVGLFSMMDALLPRFVLPIIILAVLGGAGIAILSDAFSRKRTQNKAG